MSKSIAQYVSEAIPSSIEPDTNPSSFLHLIRIQAEPGDRNSVTKDAIEMALKKRLEELYPGRRVDVKGAGINHDGWDLSFNIGRLDQF